MSNVLNFPGRKESDVLEQVREAGIEKLMVVGYDTEDNVVLHTNLEDIGDALYLMECAKRLIMHD